MQPHEAVSGRPDSLDALHLILAAWEEGTDAGVPAEFMAYAALFTAFSHLVDRFGEDNVAALAEGLSSRIRHGEFTLYQTTQ